MLTALQSCSTSAAIDPLESRRFLNAGDPDFAFSADGRTTLNFPGAAFDILDTTLQTDGKIVVAGKKGNNAAVARLNGDGSIDTTFGGGGLFEYGAIAFDLLEARGVAVGADGKIAVAGFCRPDEHSTRFTIGRLTASGARDTTFGGGLGIVRSEVDHSGFPTDSSVAYDVAIQTDEKIVAVGQSLQERFDPINDHDFDMVVVRYNVNGTHDTSFADGDGTAVIEINETDEIAHAVVIDYTGNPLTNPRYGSIVTVGQAAAEQSPPGHFALARLNPNGSADNTFSGDGRLISPSLSGHGIELANALVVQPGGKIVAGGTSGSLSDPNAREFLIARYHVNGAVDTVFGPDGTGTSELDFGGNDCGEDLVAGYNGGLVLSGVSNGKFTLAAFEDDGDLDNRFSGDGVLVTNISGVASGIAATGKGITPIRRLVVAGDGSVARFVDVGSVVFVASFEPDGAEAGTDPDPATFVVGRTEAQPFVERVFLSISGTATPPNAFPIRPRDYNGSNNITIGGPTAGPTFVDIPAGEILTTVTITPVNDATPEADETAIFSVASNVVYDIGTPPSVTLAIRDNDTVGGPLVTSSEFLFGTAPQRARFTFSQNVAGSIGTGDFTVTGPSGAVPFGFAYDSVTNTATLSFIAILPDGNYLAQAIASGITNSSGTPMASDFALNFFVLAGDANRDRIVDITDLGILAINWQQSPRVFSQGDFNHDSMVDITDLGMLATNWQKNLPAPVPVLESTSSKRPNRIVDEVLRL